MHPRLLILDPGNFTPSYDINLALALIDRGWDITWVTSSHQFDEIPAFEGLRVQEAFFVHLRRLPLHHPTFSNPVPILIRRTTKGLSYPIDLAKLHSWMCRQEPGIVHVQWALLPSLDVLFWKKWRQRGWIVVFTVHDPKPLAGTAPRLFWRRAAELCREADAVIVHGQYAHRELGELGVDEGRIHVMTPGPTLVGPPSDREEARQALGLDMNVPIILFFGYIKQYKGLHILLESLPLVKAELGKVILLVAGELMEPRSRYHRLISRLGIEGEVLWSKGYVPDRTSSLYFAAADLVALPYLQASSSAVLLTAYACQRPVVASSVGGIPEQIEDGESGYLVPPGDPTALAAALTRILTDSQLAARMATRGFQLVEEKFSWNDVAESSAALYLHLWNKRR